jgi:hypothetical protein
MRMTIAASALLFTLLPVTLAFADVGIEKTTVEPKRVEVRGTADESHEVVVTIAMPEKPLEWRSGCAAGGFTAVVEKSDSIPLDGGAKGKGFVFTKTQRSGKSVANVDTEGAPVAGVFAVRPEKACETKGGVFTFGDVTLADGTKCAVSIRLERKKA